MLRREPQHLRVVQNAHANDDEVRLPNKRASDPHATRKEATPRHRPEFDTSGMIDSRDENPREDCRRYQTRLFSSRCTPVAAEGRQAAPKDQVSTAWYLHGRPFHVI